eukprot:9751410-Ditylum_brightwellii.AAC.1
MDSDDKTHKSRASGGMLQLHATLDMLSESGGQCLLLQAIESTLHILCMLVPMLEQGTTSNPVTGRATTSEAQIPLCSTITESTKRESAAESATLSEELVRDEEG